MVTGNVVGDPEDQAWPNEKLTSRTWAGGGTMNRGVREGEIITVSRQLVIVFEYACIHLGRLKKYGGGRARKKRGAERGGSAKAGLLRLMIQQWKKKRGHAR